jgi:hypothetical protein
MSYRIFAGYRLRRIARADLVVLRLIRAARLAPQSSHGFLIVFGVDDGLGVEWSPK